MYEPFYTNIDITQIYHVVMPEPLTLIIIVNVLFLFFLLSISNFILDNIKDISRFETPESVLTDSIDIRYGMSLVLLIYIAYHMYFLLAFLSGDGIIENLDYWEFLMAYLPSLWILAWVIFWLGRSIQLRQNLVTNIDEGQKFESKKKLDLVIADTGTHRAIPVNLVGRKPVVLINSSLADELTDSEIKAVYYHEVYHITEDQQNLRRLIRLPVIGYLIALWFINPINAYRKELEADQYAAKKAGVEETASAIKTVGQMQAKMSESPKSVSRAQATLSLFKLVWSVPVFSLYRPSREQRVKELRGT
jgi:Zn-dependent protease with chaperone function